MKKYNFLVSALLAPALIFAGVVPPVTCTGGGGGSTPPTLTLPGSVTGVQKYSYAAGTTTLYSFAVSSVSSAGVISAGKTYGVWCTNPSGIVPGGGTNPDGSITTPVQEDSSNTTGSATYMPMNSYLISGNGTPDQGQPGLTWDAIAKNYTGTSHLLSEEWAAVNWILNNPRGASGQLSPTTTDTEQAIRQLLHPEIPGQVVAAALTSTSALTGNSWLLYQDALANGLSFIPVGGQVVAVLMVPTTPSTAPGAYQGFIIPVPIPCTATGSATLTKTSTVGAAGANAFQLVTYTYTIKNTGSTALGNLVIVDDNGTPNFTGDDVTINLTGVTLAGGASYSYTTSVYLPISLFYQNGNEAAFDTLIPQVIPVPTGSLPGTLPSLLMTYIIDSDVTDNTYGTGASAEWAANGGHTFAQLEASTAEFAFYNSKGMKMADFTVGYLAKGGSLPSGYKSPGVIAGSANYVTQADSTLSDNLNNHPQFNTGYTVNSPVLGTPEWQGVVGYQVVVNNGIFGPYGIGSANILSSYLANTMDSFSGKCGSAKAVTYSPSIYGDIVTSTAYLCANVCGCATVVHAKACLSVKLNGATQPTCNNPGAHQCQNPVHCGCTCSQCAAGNHGNCSNKTWWGAPAKCSAPVCSCPCAQCQAGNHGSCTKVGCTDPTCHANNCNHNTVRCQQSGDGNKWATLCW